MPLGIAYVNGALRAAGLDVDGINLMFVGNEDPYVALFNKIANLKYDVLLCGGLSAEFPILKKIYETSKLANPNIITIGGGGGFSASPILFSELTEVDYAVIGEGEITNVELALALEKGEDISKIKGIIYKDNTGYHQTPTRLPIHDLDSIPFPSYEGLAMEEYLDNQTIDGWYNYFTYYSDTPRMMPMLMSRSCPYMCSFCFHPIGRGYRARGIDNFFQELDKWIEKYQINGVALVDECFSMNPNTVIEFCNRIKPYGIVWACQMRAEIYDYKLMKLMKDSGCIGACFGIESMSQSVLDNMQKHLKQETIEKALKISYECGVGASGNILFGAETETFETAWESIKWNREHMEITHHQPINSFMYVQTYPGSRYYNNAVNEKRITDEREFIKKGQWVINNTKLSQHDFEVIGEVARLLQHETRDPGTILSISEQKEGRLTVSFICPHCGCQHTYKNISKRHLKEHRIRSLGCRSCNGMADYVIDKEYFPYEHYKVVDWMLNIIKIDKQRLYSAIIDIVSKDKVSVGILGAGYISEKLILALKGNNMFSIKWVMARKRLNVLPNSINVIFEEEEISDVDLIIDAELVHPNWVKKTVPNNCLFTDVELLVRVSS